MAALLHITRGPLPARFVRLGPLCLAWVIALQVAFGQQGELDRFPLLDLTENEHAAIWLLRAANTAEVVAISRYKKTIRLHEIKPLLGCDEDLSDGMVWHGYRLTEVHVGGDDQTFEFAVEPIDADAGRYSFNVTEDLVIRFADGAVAPRGTSGSEFRVPPRKPAPN